jgi:hypothetical protein
MSMEAVTEQNETHYTQLRSGHDMFAAWTLRGVGSMILKGRKCYEFRHACGDRSQSGTWRMELGLLDEPHYHLGKR